MSKRTDQQLLNDIIEASRRIQRYTSGMTMDSFLKDTKTQDAVIRNLEIMGEAAKGISGETRKKHTRVPWRNMAGMRDRLIHHYFGVNLDIVWNIVIEIDQILMQVEQVLNELEQGESS